MNTNTMTRILATLWILGAAVVEGFAGVEELSIPEKALCTICTGATPHPPEAPAAFSVMDDGTPVYFCSEPCLHEFEADPAALYSRALHSVMAADSLGHVEAVCSGRDTAVLLSNTDDPRLHQPGLGARLGLKDTDTLRVMILEDPLSAVPVAMIAGKPWIVADGAAVLLGLDGTHPLVLLGAGCSVLARPAWEALDPKP